MHCFSDFIIGEHKNSRKIKTLTVLQYLLSPATEQKPMVYLGQYNPEPKTKKNIDNSVNSKEKYRKTTNNDIHDIVDNYQQFGTCC